MKEQITEILEQLYALREEADFLEYELDDAIEAVTTLGNAAEEIEELRKGAGR
jgi:hypothetical protein